MHLCGRGTPGVCAGSVEEQHLRKMASAGRRTTSRGRACVAAGRSHTIGVSNGMAASRPSYAPNSRLDCRSPTERLLLRVRRRARQRWSVQKLLDEREEMLSGLDALERSRVKVAAKLRRRAMEKPAARGVIEEASRKVQSKLELAAESVRHRLLLSDSILSSRGVRPWEDAEG